MFRELLNEQKKLSEEHERQVERLQHTIDELKARERWFLNSRSWQVTLPLRALSRIARAIKTERPQFASIAREVPARARAQGLGATLRWARERVMDLEFRPEHVAALQAILATHAGKPIMVTHPGVDWAVPLFQRPQQLALEWSRQGFLVFFVTENRRFDDVEGFVELAPGCFLTNQNELLLSRNVHRTMYYCSTSFTATPSTIEQAQRRGDSVLYDYIDEIHEDLSGPMPKSLRERHELLLRDESVVVVATADRLLEEVARVRQRNFALVTNGVDQRHFNRRPGDTPHPLLAPLVKRGRPIIGYYGALANWFDHELVGELARRSPELEFVLIGPNYDDSAKGWRLHELPNVTVLAALSYDELPSAARCFSVAMVPFRLNDVTASTSPIKIFEYMSMGLPIVATDLPECRKYQSILIGRDPAEFSAHLQRALRLSSDESYARTLEREAAQNTWSAKVQEFRKLMRVAWGTDPEGHVSAAKDE